MAVSIALAACLRHGHRPHLSVTAEGRARLIDARAWPRVEQQEASAGDILEIVRSNATQRYEMGEADGCKYIRTLQSHSKLEVGTAGLFEELTEELLPDTISHGTAWNVYSAIQQHGLLPGRLRPTQGSQKGIIKGGKKEGRQRLHLFSSKEKGKSGSRESSTMLVHVSSSRASTAEVEFYRSTNGVILTADPIPSRLPLYRCLPEH